MPADSSRAVFLSYASQDAEAARRIGEALRAAGIEVWFDQDELVGGDAWDAKIRKQIKECALFVPIISANTQARREGYFRLEWKLAAQRTHTMADGTPFLLPVVIDDTHDAAALVPEEFRVVQWTRLRPGHGEPLHPAQGGWHAPDDDLARFAARVGGVLGAGPNQSRRPRHARSGEPSGTPIAAPLVLGGNRRPGRSDGLARGIHAMDAATAGRGADGPGEGGRSGGVGMVANLEGDFTRSVSFFEAALHSAPNEASNHNWMAMALDGLGRYRESLRWFQQARDLDPLVRIYWSNGLRCLARLRRTQAWLLESARMDEVLGARDYPGRFSQRFSLTGELSATPDTYQELILARDYKGALERIAATLAESDKLAEEHWELLLRKADCLRWTGRETEAELALREAEAWMERANAIPDRHDAVPEMRRMLTWARMGRAADAVAAGRRYVAGAHPELQADWRWLREIRLATVHALLGQPRECVELLDRLLKVPSGLTVPMLKIDPIWDRVRDDPGFKALLEDPRNSAPL